jgi:hypothetical protein
MPARDAASGGSGRWHRGCNHLRPVTVDHHDQEDIMIRNTMFALSLLAFTAGSAFAGKTRIVAAPEAKPVAAEGAAPADKPAEKPATEKKAKKDKKAKDAPKPETKEMKKSETPAEAK